MAKSRKSVQQGYSRRAVLAGTGAAAAWAMMPPQSWAQIAKPGAGQRVNIAVIGAGGKGGDNMVALTSQNIVAICDVDFARVGRQMLDKEGGVKPERVELKAAYDKAEQFGDYRKMLDTRKDIDAVLIATPDHHHAVAARMAMERGKHVFVQKPLTYTVRETRTLMDLGDRKLEARDYPAALKAYQIEGNPNVGRANAIMAAQVKQFKLTELKAIAGYLSKLPGDLKVVERPKFH